MGVCTVEVEARGHLASAIATGREGVGAKKT